MKRGEFRKTFWYNWNRGWILRVRKLNDIFYVRFHVRPIFPALQNWIYNLYKGPCKCGSRLFLVFIHTVQEFLIELPSTLSCGHMLELLIMLHNRAEQIVWIFHVPSQFHWLFVCRGQSVCTCFGVSGPDHWKKKTSMRQRANELRWRNSYLPLL